MIATDPLSLVFIACFLVGLLFFIVTALLGNLGHGSAHSPGHHTGVHVGHHTAVMHTSAHGHAIAHAPATNAHAHTSTAHNSAGGLATFFSYVNITSVMFFLLGFGFFGYLFHTAGHLMSAVTLVLAGASGIIIAALLLLLLSRLFGDSEGATIQDVSDRTGLLGKVSLTIPEQGIGEILYVSPGGMRKSIAARSTDGRRIERDTEVVVINYAHGVAEVDTWDHFINEEETHFNSPAPDELEKLRSLLEESNQPDTQLIKRKDPQ
ncbi:MAG TPA: hypothetical protein VFA09_11855 [Ktedonobacteraceae bacterium]|nr:hypothetical protein [Ktedonobacteraceae bacterium]